MALTLRCLGQAASQPGVFLPLAAASPKLLGCMTPKTPMTPCAMSPTFFIDRDARTPSASPFGRFGQLSVSDSEGTPLRMGGSGGPSFGMQANGYPRTMLGRRPAFGDLAHHDVEAMPNRGSTEGRFSAAPPASRRDASPGKRQPVLLGRARRPAPAEERCAAPSAPVDPGRAAAEAARAAALARRQRVAEREVPEPSSAKSAPRGLPTLLGRAPGPTERQAAPAEAGRHPAELARQAFLARRARLEAREPEAFEELPDPPTTTLPEQAPVLDAQPAQPPMPVLLGRRRGAAAQPSAGADAEYEDPASQARNYFLARQRAAASRFSADFIP